MTRKVHTNRCPRYLNAKQQYEAMIRGAFTPRALNSQGSSNRHTKRWIASSDRTPGRAARNARRRGISAAKPEHYVAHVAFCREQARTGRYVERLNSEA